MVGECITPLLDIIYSTILTTCTLKQARRERKEREREGGRERARAHTAKYFVLTRQAAIMLSTQSL